MAPPKEPIGSIEFIESGPPFRVSINRQVGSLNPLPFSVLYVVIARFQTIDHNGWPKGPEFIEKCAELWKEIDPIRYRNPGPYDSDKFSKKWTSWVDQTRSGLLVAFPWMEEDKLHFELLPDGKKNRREGLCPRLAPNCVITGVDRTVWSGSKATTAA